MKILFSEDLTNVGRQKEFDYIKLITIVVMVLIHMWEYCTNINLEVLPKGFFHNLLQFLAGPLGAPMFMVAMGIGVLYSKNSTPRALFKRGINLFVIAYVLNIFRFVIPYTFFAIANRTFDMDTCLSVLLNGDILQFAGFSFMLIALFMHLNLSVLVINGIALFMQLVGFYLSRNCPIDTELKYVLGLFYKTQDMSFPLLQWFIFPCFGMLFATFLRHAIDKDALYKALLKICGTLLIVYTFSLSLNEYNVQYVYGLAEDVFYNQDFIKTLFTLLAIIVEIVTIYFLFCKREFAKLDKFAAFAGKNLNAIYIVQWLLVGWTASIFNALGIRFEPVISLSFAVIYLILSFIIVKGYLYIRSNIKSKY